jgi:hypothetical protein
MVSFRGIDILDHVITSPVVYRKFRFLFFQSGLFDEESYHSWGNGDPQIFKNPDGGWQTAGNMVE